jgi:hypothetical protein
LSNSVGKRLVEIMMRYALKKTQAYLLGLSRLFEKRSAHEIHRDRVRESLNLGYKNLLITIVFIALSFAFSITHPVRVGICQIEGFSPRPTDTEERFHLLMNQLENSDFETDDDIDGFPDGWIAWQWNVEDELDLRKAIFEYLDIAPESIVRPTLSTRFPFFGKRSLNIISVDENTAPGIYVEKEFTPGIYTISLYAKNPGEGRRNLGLFMAVGGRLFEVGRRWRNIVHTERVPYHIKTGEISLRDWTFLPGELLVDRVVLLKMPFDIHYATQVNIENPKGDFTIDFSGIGKKLIPIGINLEITSPTEDVVRVEGRHRFKLEIYDLRTADFFFVDDDIEVVYRSAEHIPDEPVTSAAGDFLDFFPVGMRVHGHELGDLKGRDFNCALIVEPRANAAELYRDNLINNDMRLFFELKHEMVLNGCDDDMRQLIQSSRELEGFSGWFLRAVYPMNPETMEKYREVLQCIENDGEGHPVVLENYLPRRFHHDDSIPVEYIALDPNPISVPSRPLFTVGLWADQMAMERGGGWKMIGMPQVFGGWPIAHRNPTFEEVRAMTYLSVIHGAEGIMYRDFSSLRPFFDHTDASWDIRKVSELWGEIPKLNRELVELSPYFLNGLLLEEEVSVRESGYLDYRAWREGESVLLIAVNVYDGEIEGEFTLEDDQLGDEVEVLFEERILTKEGETFSDRFSPFETHVYRAVTSPESTR